jgi:hypothetical protein
MGRPLTEKERREREARAAAANRQHEAERNANHRRARGQARVLLPALDGCVFVCSDQHHYPGLDPSPAHKASLLLAKKFKPYAIISNGDAIDGASISRWPVGSYSQLGEQPTVSAELLETHRRLKEYEDLSFVKYCVWNLGNHDARFETRLAAVAPQYAGVNGFTLKDHYPGWLPAWATWITSNKDKHAAPEVVVKHRFKGGTYASHNNALWSGVSMVTGHDHMLWAKALTDYHGTRWGIGAGTMAPIYGPHFTNYTEDNPVNWQSGFVILHFRGGKFTGPELVHALPDGRVLFRGDVLKV